MDVDEDEFLGVLQASSKKFSEDWVIPHRVLRDWMWSLRFLNPELQEDFVDTFQVGRHMHVAVSVVGCATEEPLLLLLFPGSDDAFC